MLQVFVTSINANNLRISLPVHSSAYTSVFVYFCMEAADLHVVTLSDTV